MNKIYKVVWSKVKNCYVVVSEIAKNVITGSVKSAKIGSTPMAKGLALGAAMAFVITGNAWAEEYASITTDISNKDEIVLKGNHVDNASVISTSVTLAKIDKITIDGTFSSTDGEMAHYSGNVIIAGSGETITFDDIGTIQTTDNLAGAMIFHGLGGEINVSAETINVSKSDNAVVAYKGGSVSLNASEDVYLKSSGNTININSSDLMSSVNIAGKNIIIEASESTSAIRAVDGVVNIGKADGTTESITIKGGSPDTSAAGSAININGSGTKVNVNAEKVVVEGRIRAAVGATANVVFDGEESYFKGYTANLRPDSSEKGDVNLTLNDGATWHVTAESTLTKLDGSNGYIKIGSELLDTVNLIKMDANESTGTVLQAGIRGLDLSSGAQKALTDAVTTDIQNKLASAVSVTDTALTRNSGFGYAVFAEQTALYGDVELRDGKVITEMDTDDLVVDGKVTAGKLVSTNGMSIATEAGKGKFTVSALTDPVTGQTNTMMYSFVDGELVYGVNAGTGDISTQGGIDVGGAVVIKGGLKAADGKFEVDETTGNTKVNGALSVAGGKFDVNAQGNVIAGTYNGVDVEATAAQVATNKAMIEDNANAIAQNSAAINNLDTKVTDNANAITQNSSAITQNSNAIAQNSAAINNLDTKVTDNANAIAQNSSAVTQNSNAIAQNSAAINNLDTKVTDNANAIAQNSAAINDLAQAGSNNADAIRANSEAISENASAIAANTDAIKNVYTKAEADERFVQVTTDAEGNTTTEVSENFVVDCYGDEGANVTINGGKDGQITIDTNGQMVFGTNSTAIDSKGVYAGRIDTTGAHDFANAKAGINEDGEIKGASGKFEVAGDGSMKAADGKFTVDKDGNVQAETYNGVEISKDATTGNAVIDGVDIKNAASAVNDNAQAIAGLNQRLGKMNGKINKVGAGAAALAALHPLEYDPDDKLTFSAGVGNYNGENAAALGAFYRPDEKLMFSLGGTMGNGENMVNLGVSIGLDGAKGGAKLSKKELIQKVSTMEAENAAIKAENDALEDRVAKLEALVAKLANK